MRSTAGVSVPAAAGASHTRRIISRATRAESGTGRNSIPGVQGILERDGRVLLARRALEPRRGHWDLPGGFLDETEEPLDGLRREFREETGLDVEPVELLRHRHRAVRRAPRLLGHVDRARRRASRSPADDVDELRWFARDELPAEMAFPGQELVLRSWATRQEHA